MAKKPLTYDSFIEQVNAYNKKHGIREVTAKEELVEYNIISEYNGLEKLLSKDLEPKDRLYKSARFNILKYIITCVEHDPERGNYYSEENEALMRKAGEQLYEEGGMSSMHDTLVWSFIPKRYHSEISSIWDGIGGWQN